MPKFVSDSVIRTDDGRFVPTDPGNADYQALLELVKKGLVIAPADPKPPAQVQLTPQILANILISKGALTQKEIDDTLAALGAVIRLV